MYNGSLAHYVQCTWSGKAPMEYFLKFPLRPLFRHVSEVVLAPSMKLQLGSGGAAPGEHFWKTRGV